MEMVNLKINGIDVSAPKGSTILDAARSVGIEIPTLCFMKEINEIGACRICVVEANEGRGFQLVYIQYQKVWKLRQIQKLSRKLERQHLNLCYQFMI